MGSLARSGHVFPGRDGISRMECDTENVGLTGPDPGAPRLPGFGERGLDTTPPECFEVSARTLQLDEALPGCSGERIRPVLDEEAAARGIGRAIQVGLFGQDVLEVEGESIAEG